MIIFCSSRSYFALGEGRVIAPMEPEVLSDRFVGPRRGSLRRATGEDRANLHLRERATIKRVPINRTNFYLIIKSLIPNILCSI